MKYDTERAIKTEEETRLESKLLKINTSTENPKS